MSERLSPAELERTRDVTLLDIRTMDEREVMGWIPGSLHWHDPSGDQVRTIEGRVVLACATGRRSLELAKQVAEARVLDLEGGLLAWASILPLCQLQPAASDPIDFDGFRRRIRSCFVVESVESGSTVLGSDTSARDVVQELFSDIEVIALPELFGRIDQLAHQARRSGHRLDFIAKHVAEFYSLAAKLHE